MFLICLRTFCAASTKSMLSPPPLRTICVIVFIEKLLVSQFLVLKMHCHPPPSLWSHRTTRSSIPGTKQSSAGGGLTSSSCGPCGRCTVMRDWGPGWIGASGLLSIWQRGCRCDPSGIDGSVPFFGWLMCIFAPLPWRLLAFGLDVW